MEVREGVKRLLREATEPRQPGHQCGRINLVVINAGGMTVEDLVRLIERMAVIKDLAG